MFDYDSLKVMAKNIGRPITDLLALSPIDDPFYAGVGGRRRAAEWFAEIWADHGEAGSHLRRLHYQLVSADTPIRKLDGSAYQNTEDDWKRLSRRQPVGALSRPCSIRRPGRSAERRADDLRRKPGRRPRSRRSRFPARSHVRSPSSARSAFRTYHRYRSFLSMPTAAVQKYIIEVWIEKSTQNDWLEPLCRYRGVNLVTGIGEQSEIRSRELAMRAARYGAPVRIIYLSDFDPGGRSMPKAVARKVEFTIAKFDLDVDLQLIPLALTPDQCREYRLPRIPIKESERRKDKFESIFGVGATELDALEALAPRRDGSPT